MAEAIYTQALTYRTPSGVLVSVGDLVCRRNGYGDTTEYGIVTDIKRYGKTGRWQVCYEPLDSHAGLTRTTWGAHFGRWHYSLNHVGSTTTKEG
jgi:hypothetical protein